MASLFRPTYSALNLKTGLRESRRSRRWYGKFRDPGGIVRRVPLFTDKDASRSRLGELVRQAERHEVGLVDPYQAAKRRPIAEHIQDFAQYLRARGGTADYIDLTTARLQTLCKDCSVARTGDLNSSQVADWLASGRKGRASPTTAVGSAKTYSEIAAAFGVSVSTVTYWRRLGAPIVRRRPNDLAAISRWRQLRREEMPDLGLATRNHYLRALKSFANWLVREHRVERSPFAHLAARNAQVDRRHRRRTLSPKRFERLVRAAWANVTVFRDLTGRDRAMLYLVAAHTGLRVSELASLTPNSLHLEGQPPTIVVEAAYSKRRREDHQPLSAALAALLQQSLADRPTVYGSYLWPGSWHEEAAEMLRHDLAAAALPYRDEAGRVFDFHALRHQFISNLAAAGVHPKVAQQLARHSSITLTMDVYTHVEAQATEAALASLPSLPSMAEALSVSTTSGFLVPPLVPTVGAACLGLANDGSAECEGPKHRRNYKPLAEQGFGVAWQRLTSDDGSEDDGTRTRNHRIDSPVL